MRETVRSVSVEILKILISSLVLAVSFSYFQAKIYLHLQDPIEAFFTMVVLTFFLGLISNLGTIRDYLYRSIVIFILSMVFTHAITAFALIYPFTGSEVNISKMYVSLFSRLLLSVALYLFFSMGGRLHVARKHCLPQLKKLK